MSTLCKAFASALMLVVMIANPGVADEQADWFINDSGVQGGLIVHVGCGDGDLTAALRVNDRYAVHGLATDETSLQAARQTLASTGSYGMISVDLLSDERLPYIDNLVNLIVLQEPDVVSEDEVIRVLVPNGVAYTFKDGAWRKLVKPRPDSLDEWTHYLHDADNNAVANDLVVGPPRQLQWVGAPRWSRHHDRMASLTALVSSGGRIFSIEDEGERASIQLADRRKLVARDAFNGTILWKRELTDWFPHLFPYKSGSAQMPRRLVAIDDTVYVTLGLEAPVTAINAATGETRLTYEQTQSTEEILYVDGVLYLVVNSEPVLDRPYFPQSTCMHEERNWVAETWTFNGRERDIMAVDAETGRTLWNTPGVAAPLTLAVQNGVFFFDGESIVRLNQEDGAQIWRSEPLTAKSPIPSNFGPTLVLQDDVVLFSGGDRRMAALSAETGELLWSDRHLPSGHHSPEDLLVVGGLLWTGDIAATKGSGRFEGRDIQTGEVLHEFLPDIKTYWFHQRCYRSKATERFLMPSRTGIEFIDPTTEHWDINHWVRGGCIYGVMPCNGLVYAPPHSCACYIDAKLNGFNAIAPDSGTRSIPDEIPDEGRLMKGPAYGTTRHLSEGDLTENWPTLRHDNKRSGRTATELPSLLEPAWKTRLGGRLSSVVLYDGLLFVAQIDEHELHALDSKSGEKRWSYRAGGRIDSPPTCYNGCVYFGSADGYVYCLRVLDGSLVWSFRAAPMDQRLMAYGQIESVWPVHGTVLIQSDVLYCVAGRSMFLDDGLRLLMLDPVTGEKLNEVVLDEQDPETGENLQTRLSGLNMPTSMPDVLSCDGEFLYMRTQRFDLDGVRQFIAPTPAREQSGEGVHLFSGAGFLDDTWFHRSYWLYGTSIASGANGWFQAAWSAPAGRILVTDEQTVYGFGRKPAYYRWATPLEYHVFASPLEAQPLNRETGEPEDPEYTEKCLIPNTSINYRWTVDSPLLGRAMVMAGKTLFVAGPPDLLDAEAAFREPNNPDIQRQLAEQEASFQGERGGLLTAVSTENGHTVARLPLSASPVFDGMAATSLGLYMATTDGCVECFAPSQD
jgi:outer membrane protein assembly factor BamB